MGLAFGASPGTRFFLSDPDAGRDARFKAALSSTINLFQDLPPHAPPDRRGVSGLGAATAAIAGLGVAKALL